MPARAELRRELYRSQMRVAGESLVTVGGEDRIRGILAAWEPAAGEQDLRGWEWHMMRAQVHGELRALRYPKFVCDLQWGGGDDELFARGEGGFHFVVLDAVSGALRREPIPASHRGFSLSPEELDGSAVAADKPVWSAGEWRPPRETSRRSSRRSATATRVRAPGCSISSTVISAPRRTRCSRARTPATPCNRLPWFASLTDTALDIVALDDCFGLLASLNPRHAQVVEMRVFGGLTIDAAAEVLGVSHGTVEADWRMARAWLRRKLAS